MSVEILVARHGETDWNLRGLVQGQTDVPLNETGVTQAKELAEKLHLHYAPIHALYSSDLARAQATAQFTAAKLQLPINLSSNFREIHYGEAEGTLATEKNRQVDAPGAESYSSVLKRAKQEILSIIPKHKDEKIAIFTHGRLMHILIEHFSGAKSPSKIDNCTVARFLYTFSTQTLKFISLEALK